MNKYIAGSLAGLVATAPMTAVILLLNRYLPGREVRPLPPEHVTLKVADKVGVKDEMNAVEKGEAVTLAHFSCGAGWGAAYAPVARYVPGHPALKGTLFGFLVWAISYLSWLPALGIMRPATQHPARSNAFMIAAHLVWGAVTGVLMARWEEREID